MSNEASYLFLYLRRERHDVLVLVAALRLGQAQFALELELRWKDVRHLEDLLQLHVLQRNTRRSREARLHVHEPRK